MPESPQPPEATPPPATGVQRINWHRVRVYLLSMLIMVTMWFCATMLTIQKHPERVVRELLSQLPYSSSTGKVSWLNRRTLKIDDVKIGGFFYAESVIVTASPFGLWRHHIAKVQILGGQLYSKELYAAMDKVGSSKSDGLDWGIGRLEISRGMVLLNNLVADTAIPVRLGVRHPIILNAIRLGKPDASSEMKEERVVEIGAVSIVSPVDPLSPVFFFPLTRVRFTYDEFWHHHIREIDVVRPTMFLGQDLFWLTGQVKAENRATATQGPSAPWEVGTFEIQYGQLAVNAFGQPVVHFPFYFGTTVNDIRLDQLDQISAKATIPIYRFDQNYPDYKVNIENLWGNLYFNWPPTDAHANNVDNEIHISEFSWNKIAVKNVVTSVTFDPNGVYGKLKNGTCEGGLLNGNFEFYYTKGFTWNADFFANKINCQPIAEKLVGKYANLTGELDGKISVQGRATEILNCSGSLDLPNPGKLQIKSMDDLLDRLPKDMIKLKRDALKLAISAFQTYPYDHGQLKLDYQPTGGLSTLQLDGPRGQRQFSVYLHPWSLSDNSAPAH